MKVRLRPLKTKLMCQNFFKVTMKKIPGWKTKLNDVSPWDKIIVIKLASYLLTMILWSALSPLLNLGDPERGQRWKISPP